MSRIGRVWSDASSLAMGTVLEIGGVDVEGAAWLRKENDATHINVAELEAVNRGINLALKWNSKKLNLLTDSVTVYGWLATQ